jgi:CRISPR-associated protein Csd1
MNDLAKGRRSDIDGFNLNPNEHFYILGLSPSAARVSVRFFFKDSFGSFMKKIDQHYSDTAIEKRKIDRFERISVGSLLSQTVKRKMKVERDSAKQKKKNQDISPRLVGDLFKSILYGAEYPAALLNLIESRIQAEHDINREKAAIIKAYYIRKPNSGCPKEVLQMSINEKTSNIPYILGQLFSVYEQIQNAVNPEINTTIKDRYFTSAAAQPSYIFPVLGDLAQKHLSKLSKGQRIYYSQQLGSLMTKLGEQFPRRLTIPEHGSFQLGYYFQNQKRYTPKSTENGTSKASSDAVK